MDNSKLILTVILVGISIVLCLVLWIIAIMGGGGFTDGCLYRYNFNEDGSISDDAKIVKIVNLKANANYTVLSAEESSGIEIDPTTYGQWLNTGLRLKEEQKVDLEIKGEISLCKAYLPRYNLSGESNTKPSGELIEIPRIEDTAVAPVTLIYKASLGEWRNLAQLSKNDHILVSLHKEIKTDSTNSAIYDSLLQKNVTADCREGKRAYDAICGRYSRWGANSNYVDKCKYKDDCYECNCRMEYTPDAMKICDQCGCYENVDGTAPEPYRNDGKYTSPWFSTISEFTTSFDRDCKTERDYVDGAYQNEKYFWFSSDNAAGLAYRFNNSLNPSNKTSMGSGYSMAKIDDSPSDLQVEADYQILLNTVFTESSSTYLQYRFYDKDDKYADNTGGYVFSIKQTKCRRVNGSAFNDTFQDRGRVQYIITSSSKDPNTSTSGLTTKNITFNEDGVANISTSKNEKGYLWLKVKNNQDEYKDSFGQYRVQLSTDGSTTSGGNGNSTFYNKVLDPFLQNFKGKIRAASETIFKNMTCYKGIGGEGNCTNFFSYIKAILTIYIILYGMMFLLGMVKISQTDLVIRVIKIGIVAGLMNDSTFEFFSRYVFDFVTHFSDEIIANMSGYSLFSGSNSISNPLQFMDAVMTRVLISPTFAAQMMAMLSMGINGVIYFIIIFTCIGILLIVLFRSLAVYLMAYMAIGVLMGIAPLFLTFILFNRTWYLFDNWVKFTIRYLLEPVILLAGIIILTQLITIYLDYVIGYSVCWKCALPIKLPFPSIPGLDLAILEVEIFCINWFAPWGFDHRSSQMGLSMQNIAILLMLAYCLWGYLDFATKITGRLAGGAGGPSAGSMGGNLSGAIENSALKKVGLDAESRAAMKKEAKSRLKSMRKGDKKSPLEGGNRHDVKADSPKEGNNSQGAGGVGAQNTAGKASINKGGLSSANQSLGKFGVTPEPKKSAADTDRENTQEGKNRDKDLSIENTESNSSENKTDSALKSGPENKPEPDKEPEVPNPESENKQESDKTDKEPGPEPEKKTSRVVGIIKGNI